MKPGEGITVIVPGASLDEASSKLLISIAGPSANTIGQLGNDIIAGLLGDRVRAWRVRNLAKILRRTSDYISELSLKEDQLRSLSDGEIDLLISDSTKIDSDNVADMWARMLAKAVTNNHNVRIEREKSEIITSFTDQDVILINTIAELKKALKIYNERWVLEYEEASHQNQQNFDILLKPILDSYRVSFESAEDEAYALAKMRYKGLIQAPKSDAIRAGFWRHSLVDVDFDSDGRRYESLSPSKVVDALEGLDSKIPQESDQLLTITNYTIGPAVALNYSFTKYGDALMRSCEVNEPSQ